MSENKIEIYEELELPVNQDKPELGTRTIRFSKEIYVEKFLPFFVQTLRLVWDTCHGKNFAESMSRNGHYKPEPFFQNWKNHF